MVPVKLKFHFTLTREQDLKILELSHLGQQIGATVSLHPLHNVYYVLLCPTSPMQLWYLLVGQIGNIS